MRYQTMLQAVARFLHRPLITLNRAAYETGLFTLKAVNVVGKRLTGIKVEWHSIFIDSVNKTKELVREIRTRGVLPTLRLTAGKGFQFIRSNNFRSVTVASAMLVVFVAAPLYDKSEALAVSSARVSTSAVASTVPKSTDSTPVTTAAAAFGDKAPEPPQAASQPAPAPAKAAAPAPKAKPAPKKSDKRSVRKTRLSSRGSVKRSSQRFASDPFQYPQCVWYAWGRAMETTGIALQFLSDSGRSAKYWLSIVQQTDNVKVIRDKSAVRANAIAVFSHGGHGNGHVVFIESVKRSDSGHPISVVISESNWGSTRYPKQSELSWEDFLSRSDGSLKGYIYLG